MAGPRVKQVHKREKKLNPKSWQGGEEVGKQSPGWARLGLIREYWRPVGGLHGSAAGPPGRPFVCVCLPSSSCLLMCLGP